MKRRRAIDEVPWTNTRTDPESYADEALTVIDAMTRLDESVRGMLRDELAEAFRVGEHQGEIRGMRILAIARAHANTVALRAALTRALKVLAPTYEGNEEIR